MDQVDQTAPYSIRRCFLFAAYYPDDCVDEVDLFHIEALSKIGDVFYFVDSDDFTEDQCAKLTPWVKSIYREAHGAYDFGSWQRLIAELGWDRLDEYDEIVFVNNSIILVGDIREFLRAFEASTAVFFATLLLDEHYLGPVLHLSDYMERVNVQWASAMFPSCFWAFKRDLLAEPFVRNFFESVIPQSNRLDVCYAYERGFSRSILRHGINYSLFSETIFKYSSLYTEDAFKLIDLGVPFLKKKALSQDFYPIRMLSARLEHLCKTVDTRVKTIVMNKYNELAARGGHND